MIPILLIISLVKSIQPTYEKSSLTVERVLDLKG